MMCNRAAVFATVFWMGGAAIASAQQVPEAPLRFDVTALALATAEADIDSGGSFSTSRWYLEPSLSKSFHPAFGYGLSVGVGQTFYDVDGSNGITGSIDVNELTISAPVRFPVSDNSFALFVPSFSYAGEAGADLGDASTWGLLGSVAWRLSPDLVIGPGVGVFTTLEDDVQVLPFLLINWSITERWSLSTGEGLAASRGPGLTLRYKASDDWTLGLVGRYEEFEFRLDDDHPTPEGTVTDRSIPLVATATWAPSDRVSLTGFAGYSYGGELELYDQSGAKLGRSDYDPAPLYGLVGRVTF